MHKSSVSVRDVQEAVNEHFAKHYEDYVRFAMRFQFNDIISDRQTEKPVKRRALSNSHCELVTDFYLRLLDKIKTPEDAEFIGSMLEEGTLRLYINKAISISVRSKRSTFNYQESIWRDTFFDNAEFYSLNLEETDNRSHKVKAGMMLSDENNEAEREQKVKEENVLEAIESLLTDEIVDWHMIKVFRDYYYSDLTFKEIAAKYQLPVSSIFSMVKKTRELIISILSKNKLL